MHGIESLRQPYGFGSFVSKAFKKVGKGIKKVIKSPIGRAALLAGLGAYGANAGWFGGGPQSFMKSPGKWGKIKAFLSGQDTTTGAGKFLMGGPRVAGETAATALTKAKPVTGNILTRGLDWAKKNPWKTAGILGVGAGAGAAVAAGQGEEEIDETISGKGHEDYLKMRKLWDWGGEEPMFSAAEGGRVHAQQGLLATPQHAQMMEDPMSSGQGGTPNMAGLIRDEDTAGQATQQTADAELIQLIKMLASMGIPMEQLRGRTKQELVELAISVQGKGGEEQEIVEQAAEGGRVGYANGGIEDWYKEYISKRNQEGARYNPSMSEYTRSINRPIPMGGTMPEGGFDEIRRQRREQGPGIFKVPAAEGGRVGLRAGGDDSIFIDESMEVLRGGQDGDVEEQENIEMASGPYEGTSADADEHSMRLFGKPYHQLNPAELEEFQMEMDRLGSKFMNQGGIARTGYAMGTEHPIIPSKDGSQLDMRDSGGYQPHGAKEKHDDVRALLAQGEFVMTSDAVKGMGGGDREAGAKKMYNLMHNMEAMA